MRWSGFISCIPHRHLYIRAPYSPKWQLLLLSDFPSSSSITNVCDFTCTTDDNSFCCAFLSFTLLLLFFLSCFFYSFARRFLCVSYHQNGAWNFYLYIKSDQTNWHNCKEEQRWQKIERRSAINFFTLRLLFSLKEHMCSLFSFLLVV